MFIQRFLTSITEIVFLMCLLDWFSLNENKNYFLFENDYHKLDDKMLLIIFSLLDDSLKFILISEIDNFLNPKWEIISMVKANNLFDLI
jgi:hypothetical protein